MTDMQLRPFLSLSLPMAICFGIIASPATAQPNFGQPNYGSQDPNQNGPGNPYYQHPPPDVQGGNMMPVQQQQMMMNQGNVPQYGNQYGYPQNTGYMPQQQQQQPPPAQAKVSPQQAAKVYQWFLKYDEIRRRAQMNPIEKQQADGLLARGLGLFMPGQDKLAAKQLLSGLVGRYQTATQSLQSLTVIPETRQLQEAYYQYFDNAMRLFADYLKVQDNVFAVDNTGQSIAKQLIQRKLMLENLEHGCKDFDAQTRRVFGVPAYQY